MPRSHVICPELWAQLIQSTRQRVNQILHDWETPTCSQRYGRIVLLDQSKLEKLLS